MYHDVDSKLLYVGFSEKKLDLEALVECLTGKPPSVILGDPVFRVFNAIKRLSLVHAGVFKPSNHLHRYSRLSGADVTAELSRWKQGTRCKKSDFVGVGFRDGFPVSIGASVKGKIWSPARSGDVLEWKNWCRKVGALITNEAIDSDQLLEDSAQKIELVSFPKELKVLAVDWAENLYDRMHKLSIKISKTQSYMLSEFNLKYLESRNNKAKFTLSLMDIYIPFEVVLGGENGHSVGGLNTSAVTIEGLKRDSLSLKKFFEENPPTLFLLNGCTIAGCIHTDYGEAAPIQLPENQITALSWDGVDRTTESLFKSRVRQKSSIQEYMMKAMIESGAKIVFNDDNSGESADIVAIFQEDQLVRIELIHCKYSKEKPGARLSDLYEVCGQAIVSLRYKWRPEELIKHMERRNASGALKDLRFYYGSLSDLHEVKKAMRYSDIKFQFAIAQPGVKASAISEDMKFVLGSVYATVIEMTETKLRCYFDNS